MQTQISVPKRSCCESQRKYFEPIRNFRWSGLLQSRRSHLLTTLYEKGTLAQTTLEIYLCMTNSMKRKLKSL